MGAGQLKKRGKDERVPCHKVQKPYSGDEYEQIEIDWLNQIKAIEYQQGDKIQLSHKELNELVFFYLYVFDELQDGLVKFALNNGINARLFDKYRLKPSMQPISLSQLS